MADISFNNRALFEYEIIEKFQAGMQLIGHEVKSAKKGHFNLSGSHAGFRDDELFLFGTDIPSFQKSNMPAHYDSLRVRKLLLTASEIRYLLGKVQTGLTLVPLHAYTNRGLIKLEIALVRKKKKHDKREVIKKREVEREIRRRIRT